MNPRYFHSKKKRSNRYSAEHPALLSKILEDYSTPTSRPVTAEVPVIEASLRIPEEEVRKIIRDHILNNPEFKASGYMIEKVELDTNDSYSIVFVKPVDDSDMARDFVKSLPKSVNRTRDDDDDDD